MGYLKRAVHRLGRTKAATELLPTGHHPLYWGLDQGCISLYQHACMYLDVLYQLSRSLSQLNRQESSHLFIVASTEFGVKASIINKHVEKKITMATISKPLFECHCLHCLGDPSTIRRNRTDQVYPSSYLLLPRYIYLAIVCSIRKYLGK